MIGRTIGRYKIIKKLGEGGIAIVYQAHDTHLDTDVALKIIRKERLLMDDGGILQQRFEQEAKRVARLSNPNIIPILDYGQYKKTPYLVMKYIPGGTLRERMGEPIHWRDAARLLIPIARALSYAHQQGIVHRDVKPGNILLTETGEPMLSDFGIAIMLLEKDKEPAQDREAILGTPEYMAPEQALGKEVDHRADIYSLGLILYELITGQMPFIADTPISVLRKHIHEPLPPARQYVPHLPEIAQRVIARALEKDPEDRFEDMEQFGNALKLLAQPEVQPANHTIPLDDDEEETAPPLFDTAGIDLSWLKNLLQAAGRLRPTRWAVAAAIAVVAILLSSIGLATLQSNRQNGGTGIVAAQPTPSAEQIDLPAAAQASTFEVIDPRTATAEAASTRTAGQTATLEHALSAVKTQSVQSTLAARSTAAAATATEAAAAQLLETAVTPPPSRVQEIGQASEGLRQMVLALQDEGFLKTTEGEYFRLADFEESWAQIGWYQWWFTGYQPTDFVLRAHTSWESASRFADWFNAGCGFVFREQDPDNHYMIYLGLDGFVYLRGYIKGRFRELGKEYYDQIQNVQGEADVTLAVSGESIRYYVNGERVMQRRNNELPSGNLSYTLVSGTNLTFGTRCSITDVELWQVKAPTP